MAKNQRDKMSEINAQRLMKKLVKKKTSARLAIEFLETKYDSQQIPRFI